LVVLLPAGMLYPLWRNPTAGGEDDVIYCYPLRKLVGEVLREGRWPVENPLDPTGVLMADPQSAVMFPLTWLSAVLEAQLAYSLSIFVVFSIAGAGTYLYLRKLKLAGSASAFGAVAFMFGGFMVGHRVHLTMIQTAAMFPWGLWAVEGLRAVGWRALPALAAVGFLSIAAGHWAILTYMALAWAAYLLWRVRPLRAALAVTLAAGVLAAALAGPQIYATARLFAASTRGDIGYATFGENSFFPAAAVLAFFPMLMGSRTPGFYPQRWWGPWHLCEMLGYVGLATLVLAAAGVWCFCRKPRAARSPADDGGWPDRQRLVRLWAWLAGGAGLWMLGYYLPTYRLIHFVPVLRAVRCPARMLLVVDMALAVMAAVTIDALARWEGKGSDRLRRSVRFFAGRVLPVVMLGLWALVAAIAASLAAGGVANVAGFEFFAGGPREALAAVAPLNPGLWVPLLMMLATVAVVRLWLVRPASRSWLLVGLLAADLFFVARFVDMPSAGSPAPPPEGSPAGAWLAENAPAERNFRIYGLGRSYCDRPTELLLPKAAQAMGFATLGGFGAWQSPAHAHLLGFDNYGQNAQWAWLIRRNHLLSLYGVRYVLAAEPEFRRVIESVIVASGPAAPRGDDLLVGRWELRRAKQTGNVLGLRAPLACFESAASQPVALQPGRVYRLAFQARGPNRGAAGALRLSVKAPQAGGGGAAVLSMAIAPERIGTDWRHFEWTFRTPSELSRSCRFEVRTRSERPIELAGVRLRAGDWERPINLAGRLRAGQKVYRLLAELPPLNPTDPPVAIYENQLWTPPPEKPTAQATSGQIEALRWADGAEAAALSTKPLPSLGLPVCRGMNRILLVSTIPALLVYLALAVTAAISRSGLARDGR